MNESLVKYLAGLLDADGSLVFSFKHDANRNGRHFLGLRLSLASSTAVDKAGFIDTLPEQTGMGSVTYSGEKTQFKTWCISKRADLEMILPRLIKHMYIKGNHWNWLLNMWRAVRTDKKTCSLDEMEALKAASKESRRLTAGPVKPKNHPTWAWLAGYLDGDGCYCYTSSVHNGYRQWQINVSAVAHENDMCVLTFLKNAFGGNIVSQGQSPHVFLWRRSLGYQNRDFALEFLPNLAKHSRMKRGKIDAMIHHHRQRLSVPGTQRRYCEVEGCEMQRHGNGLCKLHYQRFRRHGNINGVSDSLKAS